MDYSKTHYYKYTTPTTSRQTRTATPVFETDDTPAAPGLGPAGTSTPDLESNIPDNGPTVNLPSIDVPAAPGEGPMGTPTPSLPSSPSYGGTITIPFPPVSGGSSTNTGNNILWSYSWLPSFSSINAVAQARFYNVNAMMEPVDIYINGQLVVSDLDYTEYTDYLYIIPGYYTITIYRRTNPGFPILNTRVNFVRNSNCTISLIGTVDTAGLQFIC